METSNGTRVDLCGLGITFDAQSGGLLALEYDGISLLQASPGKASLLDAAYPGYGFEPLRLGTRHTTNARVEQVDGGVEVVWDALGMSRNFDPKGSVYAKARFAPSEDGRSIVLTATVENRSELAIPQVLFPDLYGLLPFAGKEETELRTCGCVKRPFVELELAHDDGWWYAERYTWSEMKWGAYDKTMAARWMDLGSLRGGISLFPKLWSWGPLTAEGAPVTERVLLNLSQSDATLRVMCEHKVTIQPGETWTSPEYVLTPHRHGWAKGIEPFRAWLRENVQRPHPMPPHLRRTLGFRNVWMAQQYVDRDPRGPSVVWRFRDLPRLAEECRAHGMNEMLLWLWSPWTITDAPSPELGTIEEFNEAVAACREMGVNVSLFVSVMTLLDPLPAEYEVNGDDEFWAYHGDFIPMNRPYYAKTSRGSFAVQSHPKWQKDVTACLMRIVDQGRPSICWDQAKYSTETPNIETIFAKVRAAAREKDPEATFSAENLNNIDLDSRWLDYTWDWALFNEKMDLRALVNAYPTPRFNVNVGSSPRVVKRLFADHLFMTVMPSKPDGVNGSAYITDCPELSNALKTCAALHAKFRDYFEDGVPVGDCLLASPCREARINAYVLTGRALIVVLNTGNEAHSIDLDCEVSPWLGWNGAYRVTPYDEPGMAKMSRVESSGAWRERLGPLNPNELVLVEVVAEDNR
ncbi:MAG: hypothetical protein RBU21_10755 [FCB group bacterium]|jgi:hypothetical protein|nr:hypothetical protein [FCB group bacterium]